MGRIGKKLIYLFVILDSKIIGKSTCFTNSIVELNIARVHGEKFIGLVLQHPEKYIFKGPFYRSFAEKMNLYLTNTHIQIGPHLADMSQDGLYALMQQMISEYRQDFRK